MRHIKNILAAMAMLILSAVPAAAVEGLEGSVTGGVEYFAGEFNNAKFNEYRVKREGPWGGFFAADFTLANPDSNHMYDFSLAYRSPEDVDFNLETMSYGEYKFFVKYQRFGHMFARDVKSLYSGDGTGTLRISDDVRNDVINPGATFSVTGLQAAVADANTIDLFLTRDRVTTGLEWMSIKPLTLYTLFDYEHRDGDRGFMGGFGFSGAIEIPEPIDYDTYNVKAGAEFAGKPFYADISYRHSTFDNNIQSVTFDNIRLDPDRGRMSLAPSNSYDSVSAVLAKNLPLRTRVLFNFNYAWYKQDERLLPPTINPAIVVSALPRDTADTAVDTATYEARLTSSPIDRLELKAGFRYYTHENRTGPAVFPTVFTDTGSEDLEESEYVSWIARTVTAEASYEILRRTRVGFEYEHESESYTKGTARSIKENSYKLFIDSRALDYLTARLTLEHKNREADYPADDPALLRKYYAADRDLYLGKAQMTVMPVDDLSVTLDYSYEDIRYEDAVFGLHDGRGHIGGIDLGYQPAWWLGMNAFYTYENLRSRQNNSASPNWRLKTTDETNTAGGGVDIGLIRDRLGLKLDGLYAKTEGRAVFTSSTPLLPFDPVDETTLLRVGGTLKYNATKALELSLGYAYEKWDMDDYQLDGVTEVVVTAANAYRNLLTMDALYKPYEVHTVFAAAKYKF